ncbi:MAG: Crp/Fnr family transcriptional regulator [Bacteroidales bacterium]
MKEPTPENIKKLFDNYFKADLSVWEKFSKHVSVRRYRKNENIKEYNSVEKYVNILIHGSVGLFVWNGTDDICINLFYEHELFSDYLSFLKQKETAIKSQALEDCEIWSVRYESLQGLYQEGVAGVHVGKIIAEELFIEKQSEQIDLLTLSPTERYKKLLAEKSKILRRTPLKVIASYLGVLPESLSRIRTRI